ncbi:unnamed protein product [Ixodes persulcatus]
MTRALQGQRRRTEALPAAPRASSDTVLTTGFVRLADGQQFLLFDGGSGDPDRLIMLGTRGNLTTLQSSPHWFADGTFKIAPCIYYKLYTIHALVSGRVVPMVYFLLKRKTTAIYTRVFNKLLELQPGLSPESFLSDFEQAAIHAFKSIFPAATAAACFFT